METASQIFEYLPLKYKNPSDTDYFSFPAHSVEQNYKAENCHFAIVALHMIYMGIVYHYIYGIFRADKKRFEYVLIGFHDRLQVKEIDNISWHSFSNENESTISTARKGGNRRLKKRVITIACTLTANSAAVFQRQYPAITRLVAPHVGGR